MERLTFFEGGRWWIRLNRHMYGGFPEVDRLAAYEDAMPIERAQELAQAEKDGRLVILPPNDPLTLEELRGMDGEPVYSADGECYIVNVQNEYAADKYRGFRTLWEEGFFYRRKPEEGTA